MTDHTHRHDQPLSEEEYERAMMDPHGFHAGDAHHGHFIISTGTLLAVLSALMVLTVLTVFASRSEVWIADTFDVMIPQWVNVTVAMSIAVVKATLVCLFFMQLKYDNPLNGVIFLFCLFAAALFLGLTSIDIGGRGAIYEWKSGEISAGGDPVAISRGPGGAETITDPIADHARQKYIAEHGEAEWIEHMNELDAAAAHHSPFDPPEHSTPDKSRPGLGVDDPLFPAPEVEHAGEEAGAPATPAGGH